jgi:hypothetical protein
MQKTSLKTADLIADFCAFAATAFPMQIGIAFGIGAVPSSA